MFDLFPFIYVSQKHENLYFSTSSQFLPMLLLFGSFVALNFGLIL